MSRQNVEKILFIESGIFMRELNDILEIIQEFKKLKNKTQVAVALNMTAEALSKHKERKTLPLQQLLEFCQKESISFDWLVLGEGENKPKPVEDVTLKDIKKQLDKIEKLLKK